MLITQYSTSWTNAVLAFKRLDNSKRCWTRTNSNGAHISGALQLEDPHEVRGYEEVFVAVAPIRHLVELTRSEDYLLGVAELNQAAGGPTT